MSMNRHSRCCVGEETVLDKDEERIIPWEWPALRCQHRKLELERMQKAAVLDSRTRRSLEVS